MRGFLKLISVTNCFVIFQIPLQVLAFSSLALATGEIKGIVLEKDTREPLMGANVIIVESQRGAATGPDGRFLISKLPVGTYALEASIIGYERKRIENIEVKENGTIQVSFELAEEAIPLSEVIVTPGHFSMMQKEPTIRQALKREDIRSFPQLGEDIYRAVTRLPGLAGNDYSSKFSVRGGENEEVLVLLDGLELYEPFHLKDFGGSVSVIDVEAIGGIDMITGAFTADYGDRLSGVFNIKTASPSLGQRRTSLGISFMNARFLTEGYFGGGKGRWLVLARRGYIDLVLKLIGEDDNLSPKYYDVLGKIQYQLNAKHSIAAHYLLANDKLDFIDDDDGDEVFTRYGSMYSWLTLDSNIFPELFVQTVFSFGHVDQDRQGMDLSSRDASLIASASDVRDFNFYGLKQDWDYTLSNRYLLRWGFDAKRVTSDYDYFNRDRISVQIVDGTRVIEYDTTQALLNPTGSELGVYLSNRLRILRQFTAEVGIRYDYASWIKDKNFSPRVNLAYAVGQNTTLRFGWGQFYQSQGIHELDVQDGDKFFYPAELAEHRVFGLEHVFETGINLRVESYHKKLSDIRPRYQNLSNQLEYFPEVEDDRIRVDPEHGEAKGVELFIKKDTSGKFSWWVSYGFAFAEDEIDEVTVPRNFDQRHTFYFDFNYKPNKKWRINMAWQFHSGWPYTESTFERVDQPDGSFFFRQVYGPLNAERFPAYHRLDFRVNRYFDMSKGRLSVFLEFRNLYNRENVRLYDYDLFVFGNGNFEVTRIAEHWLPLLPSLGISWDF